MGGVPFSKACQACKDRRVKCDEQQPQCSQCLRLGRGPCPGYRPTSKFVDEGLRLRKRHAAQPAENLTRESQDTSASPGSTLSAPTCFDSRPALPPPTAMPGAVFGSTHRTGFELLMRAPLLVVYSGRTLSCLDILAGSSALKRTLARAEMTPSWLLHIPSRLGHDRMLDAAVDLAFTAAAHLSGSYGLDDKCRLMEKYAVALGYVRNAIEALRSSISTECLAAVLLLTAWESMHSTSIDAWYSHQRGVYRLLEKRGPDKYRTDFELQLLRASAAVGFVIAMRDDQPCFLDQAEWQKLLYMEPTNSTAYKWWKDSCSSLPLLCLIPRILTACRDIVRNRASQTAAKIEAVVSSAERLRVRLLAIASANGWAPGCFPPSMQSRGADEPWRVFLDAEDQVGEHYANLLSGVVILNRVISAVRPCGVDDALERECLEQAGEIRRLHSFIRAQPELGTIYIVHSERPAMAVLMTADLWTADRTASDAGHVGGGPVIEQWKFDIFDDILTARSVSAPLMYHYGPPDESSLLRVLHKNLYGESWDRMVLDRASTWKHLGILRAELTAL